MADIYAVVVEHNLVRAIERCAETTGPIPATPLEVSTQLARNNRARGCIDGRYLFADTQAAKIFASLCLEFTRALADRRLAAVNALAVGVAEYRADDERADGSDPGAR